MKVDEDEELHPLFLNGITGKPLTEAEAKLRDTEAKTASVAMRFHELTEGLDASRRETHLAALGVVNRLGTMPKLSRDTAPDVTADIERSKRFAAKWEEMAAKQPKLKSYVTKSVAQLGDSSPREIADMDRKIYNRIVNRRTATTRVVGSTLETVNTVLHPAVLLSEGIADATIWALKQGGGSVATLTKEACKADALSPHCEATAEFTKKIGKSALATAKAARNSDALKPACDWVVDKAKHAGETVSHWEKQGIPVVDTLKTALFAPCGVKLISSVGKAALGIGPTAVVDIELPHASQEIPEIVSKEKAPIADVGGKSVEIIPAEGTGNIATASIAKEAPPMVYGGEGKKAMDVVGAIEAETTALEETAGSIGTNSAAEVMKGEAKGILKIEKAAAADVGSKSVGTIPAEGTGNSATASTTTKTSNPVYGGVGKKTTDAVGAVEAVAPQTKAETKPLSWKLLDSMDDFLKHFPDFEVWENRVPSGATTTSYSDTVSLLVFGSEQHIIKVKFPSDALNEFMGTRILNSLSLQELHVTNVRTLYRIDSLETVLLKEYAAGETLEKIFQTSTVPEIESSLTALAKAYNELQLRSRQIAHPAVIERNYFSAEFKEILETTNEHLAKLKLELISFPPETFNKIVEQAIRNHRYGEYVVNDTGFSNFVYSKGRLSLVDSEGIVMDVNTKWKPTGRIGRDLHHIVSSTIEGALNRRMAISASRQLAEHFAGKLNPPIEPLDWIIGHLYVIRDLSLKTLFERKARKSNRDTIEKLVLQVNGDIAKHETAAVPKKLTPPKQAIPPSQLPDYSGSSMTKSVQKFAQKLLPNSTVQIRDSGKVLSSSQMGKSGDSIFFVNDSHVIKSYLSLGQAHCNMPTEMMAYDILEGLSLPISFPKRVMTGRSNQTGLLAMTHVPGKSLATLFEEINLAAPAKRPVALRSFHKPVEAVGRFLGDLHNKTLQPTKPSAEYLSRQVEEAKIFYEYLQLRPHKPALSEERFQKVIEGFQRNPGMASATHGDVHYPNFFFCEKTGLHGIDPGALLKSLDSKFTPVGAAAGDYAQWQNAIATFGGRANWSKGEIRSLQKAFNDGYRSKFPQELTEEAKTFFFMRWKLYSEAMGETSNEVVKKGGAARSMAASNNYPTLIRKVGEDSATQPGVATAIKAVEAEATTTERKFLHLMLEDSTEKILEHFPKVDSWEELVPADATRTFYKEGKLSVLKVLHGSKSYIIKVVEDPHTAVNEFVSSRILPPLEELNITSVQTLYQAGRHTVLVKEYAAGKTLEEVFKSASVDEMNSAVTTLARAYNELQRHSRKIAHPSSIDRELFHGYYEETLEIANENIFDLGLGLRRISLSDETLNKLVDQAIRNQKYGEYTLSDPGFSNLVYSKGRLSLVDSEFIADTITPKGKPVGRVGSDIHFTIREIMEASLERGMTVPESRQLAEQFTRQLSQPVEPLDWIHAQVDTIRYLAEKRESSHIAELVQQVNRDIAKYGKASEKSAHSYHTHSK